MATQKETPMEVDAEDKKKDTAEKSKSETESGGEKKDEKVDLDAITIENMREHCRLIERAESQKEPRLVGRVLRSLVNTRKRLNENVLSKILTTVLTSPSLATHRDVLLNFVRASDPNKMEVDVPKSATKSPRTPRRGLGGQGVLPEVEIYLHLLVLLYLIDKDRITRAVGCCSILLKRIEAYDRRAMDPLAAKAYFYYSLVSERAGTAPQIRTYLNGRLRIVTLRRDEESQATLINCLLRNYLNSKMYDPAGKLIAKVTFPESANNNEWARHLYYLGRIRAMQLDYLAAQKHLLQAMRKAPQHTAIGFKQRVQKFSVVVNLLLGEIPERSIFRQPIYRKTLAAYMQLTQAVRTGDLAKFQETLDKSGEQFERDNTYSLIVRLRQNVIKTAVRQISTAYSRITLDDISTKLQLASKDEAEYIVAKAINDGVIEASINEGGFMQSSEPLDVYSTSEPQHQFDNRITFCLELYNHAVKALRYPPDSHTKDIETAEEQREREQQELEFAKELAEEDDDDF